jgi:hypothetical protein
MNTIPHSASTIADSGDEGLGKGPRRTRLINREAVRELLLELAKKRAHSFTRVSEETLIGANEAVRAFLVGHVNRVPSKGKTL